MRRASMSWGGLLILLGILFLLDSLDIININVWGLIWPLLIIWFGLQLLWGASRRGEYAAGEQVSIPIKGIEQAHVRVNYGAGELLIHGRSAPDQLLEGEFGRGMDYDVKDASNRADVTLSMPAESFFAWPWWGPGHSRRWSFSLNDSVPLSLEVNTGASRAELDLTDLQVTNLVLKTGASETTVTLPANATYTKVGGETGMAAVHLRVPEGVAARIRTSGGLSEFKVDRDRFPRSAGGYQSADYDTAENKVDIDISVGLGSATIR